MISLATSPGAGVTQRKPEDYIPDMIATHLADPKFMFGETTTLPSNSDILNAMRGPHLIMKDRVLAFDPRADQFYATSGELDFDARGNALVAAQPETALGAHLAGVNLTPENLALAEAQIGIIADPLRAEFMRAQQRP